MRLATLPRYQLATLPTPLQRARNLEKALGPQFAPPQLLIEKVEAGELGRKSGRGFYDWD